MQRVVLDTNVIVSGLLSRKGAPAQVLDAWRERRFLLVASPAIVAEVSAALHYPHIRHKYVLVEADNQEILALLEHDALLVPGNSDVAGSVPLDAKDEMFLACAVDGQVDMIVSGDHHLLELGAYRDIPIITVRQFLERLKLE